MPPAVLLPTLEEIEKTQRSSTFRLDFQINATYSLKYYGDRKDAVYFGMDKTWFRFYAKEQGEKSIMVLQLSVRVHPIVRYANSKEPIPDPVKELNERDVSIKTLPDSPQRTYILDKLKSLEARL